ncbi:MAG: DPP IV N-terminal domain-containing protein [Bacteroidales bacterium]|nr:DPP IV N-terminal domain-containing protein [Bacteroidales bacterium]
MATTPISAQELKQFTLEDLNFGGENYRKFIPERLYTTWWGDQLMYQDVEESGLIDMKTGKKRALFTLDDINGKTDGEKVRTLQRVSFPYPDKTLALVQSKTTRMLFDWSKCEVVWKQTCEGETETHWNKTSRTSAYVKDNQLWITNAEGKTKQLTTDGSREIVYGQAVHRNEFGIEEGIFWAPDGNRFAFYRMDQSMVTDYPQVNTFERVATYEPDKYPMLGMTSHKVTVGIYDCTNGNIQYLKAGDPTNRYFTNIAWSPDSKTVYMFELNRLQNDCQLVSYDATSGNKLKELYREKSDKYVEPMHPIVFLPWDSKQFVMQSRRDGYNHLYLMNTEGKVLKQLTKGQFEVIEMLGFNTKDKTIIIQANAEKPVCHNLYSVNVKTGKRTLLDNGRGVHNATLSAAGRFLADTWSEPTMYRQQDYISTTTGKAQPIAPAIATPWPDYKVPTIESGTVKAADGKTDLYYRLVKPVDFDPNKKYPTVVYVYGGPHAHNVQESFNYWARPWEIYMAQRGYVLFIVDNRGSQYRGFDFESCTHRHLGDIEMADQMAGVAFLKTLPYVDADRIGVHGWSFGGFMTTNLMCSYPETFKVGVAGGPVIDWKYYEVMYGERYMDTPEENPEGYETSSLLGKAKNLRGRLQIIVGLNDPTCVLQHSLAFLRACEDAGTQPDYFVYPGQGHNMMGPDMVHLHERITRYFDDYLK